MSYGSFRIEFAMLDLASKHQIHSSSRIAIRPSRFFKVTYITYITYITSKRLSHVKTVADDTSGFIKQSCMLLDLIFIHLKTAGHL